MYNWAINLSKSDDALFNTPQQIKSMCGSNSVDSTTIISLADYNHSIL